MYLIVEIIFYSGERKHLPDSGYRPDAKFNGREEYWGISFVELTVRYFDTPTQAILIFSFDDRHYQEVKEGQHFQIMEGPRQVGEGKILSIEQ